MIGSDKTLNILGQERNVFWSNPDYILDWYKKLENIHLKDDILKEINDKFTSFDESFRDDGTKIQITSVIQMLCSTNLDIIRLQIVFAAPFFKPEYKKLLVPFCPFLPNQLQLE